MIRYTLTVLFLVIWGPGFTQPSVILLENPSFEDDPMPGRPPKSWYFCGLVGETPPDIHPIGIYGQVPPPFDGGSYVGLVARDNDSWESIGQELNAPLRAGTCYSFVLYAARSAEYRSISRSTGTPVNYDTPLSLRIYGATKNCDGRTLLSESPPVAEHEWKPYQFFLHPETDFDHLILEASYAADPGGPYNGNLLLDHCSAIIPINCTTREVEAKIDRLHIPDITSADSLRRFIAEHGAQLDFKGDDSRLESHFFLDERQVDQQMNRHLWLIAKALRRFPRQQLDIRIAGKDAKEKIMTLHSALRRLQVPEQQYRLKILKKRDQKDAWLWKTDEQEIFMKLNPI